MLFFHSFFIYCSYLKICCYSFLSFWMRLSGTVLLPESFCVYFLFLVTPYNSFVRKVTMIHFSFSSFCSSSSSFSFCSFWSLPLLLGRRVGQNSFSSMMSLELPLLSSLQSNNNNKKYDLRFTVMLHLFLFLT